ncbi:MAG: hypothetical protein A4E42_00326 [Methanoregulaceae archaeon PtaU1.Bin222]|nr:MAG: hypothetical protein A4E42_00326 [Methanoregulaceae archaeon PtaU1.Bin222]
MRVDLESIAIPKAITPTPPTHCMNERQKRSVFGVVSRLPITVNPVPVHPDMASKMLSVTLIWRPKIKGMAPMTAMTSQMSATAASATESCGTYSFLGMRDMRKPRRMKTSGTETMGRSTSQSPKTGMPMRGIRVIPPRNSKMLPMS